MSGLYIMIPHPDRISGGQTSDIDQVVVNYAKHLPEFGVELVTPDAAAAIDVMRDDGHMKDLLNLAGWSQMGAIGRALIEDRNRYHTIWMCQ